MPTSPSPTHPCIDHSVSDIYRIARNQRASLEAKAPLSLLPRRSAVELEDAPRDEAVRTGDIDALALALDEPLDFGRVMNGEGHTIRPAMARN